MANALDSSVLPRVCQSSTCYYTGRKDIPWFRFVVFGTIYRRPRKCLQMAQRVIDFFFLDEHESTYNGHNLQWTFRQVPVYLDVVVVHTLNCPDRPVPNFHQVAKGSTLNWLHLSTSAYPAFHIAQGTEDKAISKWQNFRRAARTRCWKT